MPACPVPVLTSTEQLLTNPPSMQEAVIDQSMQQPILVPTSTPVIQGEATEEEIEKSMAPLSFMQFEILVTVGVYLFSEMVSTLDLHLRMFTLPRGFIGALPSVFGIILSPGHLFICFHVLLYLFCMDLVHSWTNGLDHDDFGKLIVHYRFFRCLTGINTIVFSATIYMSDKAEVNMIALYMERTVQIFYAYLIAEFCFYLYNRNDDDTRTIRPAMRSWIFGMTLCCLLCITEEETVKRIAFSMGIYACFAQISIFLIMNERNLGELTHLEEIFDAIAILLAVYFGTEGPGVAWLNNLI